METKTIYREFFPGYMGHIPMKGEVIGLTVGATNEYIKGYMEREPNYNDKLVPSVLNDYSNFNKNYLNNTLSKEYPLEEEKAFSNKSKDSKTWIHGSKYQIYPQHIPGYKAHIPGINSANIFGQSYAKSTAVAVKGEYCNKVDFPPEERYLTISKQYFTRPKVRSEEEEKFKNSLAPPRNKSVSFEPRIYVPNIEKKEFGKQTVDLNNVSETFIEKLNLDKKPVTELPFIVGYKGFRRGIRSGNYYGKNFKEISLDAKNTLIMETK